MVADMARAMWAPHYGPTSAVRGTPMIGSRELTKAMHQDHLPEQPNVLFLGGGPLGEVAAKALSTAGVNVIGAIPRRGATPGSRFLSAVQDLGWRMFDPAISWADLATVPEMQAVDYLLSVQYDRIVPKYLLDRVAVASLNVHLGPLPRLRGCFPTKWAILEGGPSGVTIHHMDPGIDTGNIVLQELVDVANTDTDETLYAKLVDRGRGLVLEAVGLIEKGAVPVGRPQVDEGSSYHPKELPNGGVIDWWRPALEVGRMIRAFTFPPYPGAVMTTSLESLQVRAPFTMSPKAGVDAPGVFSFEDGVMNVGCRDGSVCLSNFVVEGKRADVEEVQALLTKHGISCFNS